MTLQSHATIDRELREAGLESENSVRRARIAAAIRTTGQYFGKNEVIRLRAHFAVGYVGLASDEALCEALLDGTWVAIEARQRASERKPEPASTKSSGMQFVTAENPYGWAAPERMTDDDHNVPGKWNAFRQEYNLTEAERAQQAAPDYRRRGCSRDDVVAVCKEAIGWRPGQPIVLTQGRHATAHSDASAVAAALAKESERRCEEKELTVVVSNLDELWQSEAGS